MTIAANPAYNHGEQVTPSPANAIVKVLNDEIVAFDPFSRKRSRRIAKDVAATGASAVIAAAQANLTAGRTSQESVYLSGNIIINTPIAMASFTKYIGDAKITCNGTGQYNFIQPAVDIQDITFDGLYFGAPSPEIGYAIYPFYYAGGIWQKCTNLVIRNCYFDNLAKGVVGAITYDSRFINNKFYLTAVGLEFMAGKRNFVDGNVFTLDQTTAGPKYGIWSVDTQLTARYNKFYGNSPNNLSYKQWGIWFDSDIDEWNSFSYNDFAWLNCSAISIDGSNRPFGTSRVRISQNNFYLCGKQLDTYSDGCISVGTNTPNSPTTKLIVTDNTSYDCTCFLFSGKDGQNIANQGVVKNNYIDYSYLGIVLFGNNFNFVFKNNEFVGLRHPEYVTIGAGTLVLKGNTGFLVSENSGASTGTGSEQTIAHGLAITPTRQQIILSNGSATANAYHSKAPDATNFYVVAGVSQDWYWNVP
jgi:hypothetical protein